MTNEEANSLLDLVEAHGEATAAATAAVHRGDADVLDRTRAADAVLRDIRARIMAGVERV